MKKFIVLYLGPRTAQQQMFESTPEAAQEGMKAWMEWAGRAGDGIVDLGNPLLEGREITASGTADTASEIGGYAIVQAEDMAAAEALFDGHPHLMMPGAKIQVYESVDLQGV